jgi:glutathione S-transferase
MGELILHQYEMSPFSEKIRRILAFKGLAYRAVRAPAVLPKPELTALTGGYRKIPVLQIDNHVYCDSALIARVMEQHAPQPSLYVPPLAEVVAHWADATLFEVSTGPMMRPTRLDDLLRHMSPDELTRMRDDRRAMRAEAVGGPSPKSARVYLALYLSRLESILRDTPYVCGANPSIADFSCYHSLWMLQRVAPEHLIAFAQLQQWMQRIAAIPDAPSQPMAASEAVRICRDGARTYQPDSFFDPLGLQPEQAVLVRANDYGRDPIEGALVGANADEVVLRRGDVRAGTVYVHFPRLGFEISAARTR